MPKQKKQRKPKVNLLPEDQTRKRILAWAKVFGCEQDVLQLMAKYDNLLRNCTNQEEHNAIATMAIIEIQTLMFGKSGGNLVLNGKEVLPGEKINKNYSTE